MSILKSTNSGKVRYLETILLNRGYYKNYKYNNLLIHPNDIAPYNVPDDVFCIEATGLVTVYITVGNWGKRVPLIDMDHLKMIEDYWSCRRRWIESSFKESIYFELSKQLGREIIHYADTH